MKRSFLRHLSEQYGLLRFTGKPQPGRSLATRFRPAHNVDALPEAPYRVTEYSST